MNDSFNPQAAVAEFEQLVRNTEVPEAMRALAEKNITQTREVYERSKDALGRAPLPPRRTTGARCGTGAVFELRIVA